MNDAMLTDASSAATLDTLDTRLARFAPRHVQAGEAVVSYREAPGNEDGNEALPLVLLHGIGSDAASWVQQLEMLGGARRVLAWDAPGYGASTPVASASPVAADYTQVLADWLDALGVMRCVLVGHSLGATIAGSFAATHPQRVSGLLLISPVAGYRAADSMVLAEACDARLAIPAELEPHGLADERSANILVPHASNAVRAWVGSNMARVRPRGNVQATHLLENGSLALDVAAFRGRTAVAVGANDSITPPSSCERIAMAGRSRLQIVPRAGHAGYIESPAAYTTLIETFYQLCERRQGGA
jgi:pimeloyl-ACP methyl ester carboxylesterase